MIPGKRTLAGLGLGHRHAVSFGECGERGAGEAVQHAAAGDQQRAPCVAQQRSRAHELGLSRRLRAKDDRGRREECVRIVAGHRLDVLRQCERDRAAQRGIGQHIDRVRERGQKLRRMHDAVEIARHRPEAIVGRHARVIEVLDLLQHRVRRARGEHVAGQQQHRQPVDMRQRGRRHHVGRAGTYRGRARHHPPPHVGLGVGDRGMRHRLLVVRPVGRKLIAIPVQGFADTGDVAVAEDREHAAEQRPDAGTGVGRERGEIAHQRLRRGQPDGAAHAAAALRLSACSPRVSRHAAISASKFVRTARTSAASSMSPESHLRLGS